MNEESLVYFDEIDLKSIVRDVIRNAWMIVIVAISAALLMSGYQNIMYEAEYTSKATLVVSAKGSGVGSSYSNLTTTVEMNEVFSNVFSSNVLKKRLTEEMGLQGESFEISAKVVPETNLMVLSATGENPQIVYRVICGAIEQYSNVSDYVFSNAVLDVMENPEVPLYPSNTIPLRSYQKKAMVLAAAAMGAFLVGMSILRGTVKTEAAARRRLKGTKLALVGHEEKNRTLKSRVHKKNKAILITNPTTTFGYVETFRKLAFRIQSEMKQKNQKILLVSSVGENEGKSTVSSNIAIALAQSGKKVILVDMDLRRPAIYKIFEMDDAGQDGFWSVETSVSRAHSMQLILNKKTASVPAIFMKDNEVGKMLKYYAESADIVIVDSSPMNVASDTELLLSYADASILVVRKDWALATDVNRSIEVLEQGENTFLGYVLNDYRPGKPKKRGNYGYGYEYGAER